ncbi:MdtA/MuxA family multidrug efflux RND transporter periplasmic adaptor subunit [Acidisoma cladoniae]|jgi:multidrug efflux system membrane fusion protein|uniref:MdtA/MuxA family multidrug efflux RND transporter periplasmic adaptor subunit n=1 Tax=Acidisoma cladoniae TaxID=3040935 RepID=UPI00254FCDAF|nr:MdtA/MuxA family multidrug efflux RND transporter periplasmic adaptor subunit [Acidisoma sp. PAMC 29798]
MDTQLNPKPSQQIGQTVSRRSRRRLIVILLFFLVAAGGLAVWLHRQNKGDHGGTPGGQTPQSVSVAAAERDDIPIVLTGLGTVTALATVTVKSQISGYLTQIAFTEGSLVHKGDLLAQVDPRPYEALLAQYKGTLAKDQASLDDASLNLARYRRLSQQDSISKQNVDTQAATVREYEGSVRADQAEIEAEKLNIAYCQIISPVDGRIGLRQVDVGNFVEASDTTGIVIVTQIKPMSVLFTLPEDAVPQVRARFQIGAKLEVDAYDRSNTTEIAKGTLATLDNEIDATTGTLKLRAVYLNTDDALFPEQFVNARLLIDTIRGAITVPPAAVQQGVEGSTVYVVDSANKVHLRVIKTGVADAKRVAITSGLAVGERVVTDGADRLQDGASVVIAAAAPQL